MKFLIGLILGGVIAVGVMSTPGPRQQLIEQMISLVNKAKQLSRAPKTTADTMSDVRDVVHNEVGSAYMGREIDQTTIKPTPAADRTQLEAQPEPAEVLDAIVKETTELATSDTESGDVSLPNTASLFQVAWSPFRSETSAKGFAESLEHKLSQEFQVIKTGPGKYEVGFLFESDPQRADILRAINKITGYESSVPPRIVKI